MQKMRQGHTSTMLMLEYYRVFAEQIKPLPPELQLQDLYHP